MRLKKIKLSGFKSFVDVATFPVEKNLVGIVGPNGCGKSNVIDAVRWVMGESSAKQLRGDSMTDVIFNGTSTRKPVSQASVELIFDNSVKQLTGQYANYTEISVKRVINREGSSIYYLNNSKCRRKDLLDLFMGTGLGPRSYTIIEQGMISRVIEAKPEDLRVYLEEAAGISKYKERRRETENRIKHTRENLERLNDISEELGKQLEKLARQSETAEKYKLLKQDLTESEQHFLGMQFDQFNNDFKSFTTQVNQKNVAIEQLNSKIETQNLELEKSRIDVSKLQHQQQEEQGKYFRIEQNISTIEQEIKHQESEKLHAHNNLRNNEKQLNYCENNLVEKSQDLELVGEELAELEPSNTSLKESVKGSREQLKELEQLHTDWEKEWSSQQEEVNINSKIISQSQALIEKHDTLIIRSQKRVDILRQEQQQIKQQRNTHNISLLKEKFSELEATESEKQERLEILIESIDDNEQSIDDLQEQLNSTNKDLQAKQGRLTSLKTLQENALGKDKKILNQWLQDNGLEQCRRLGEIVTIESGWEKALETILRDYIKAIIIPDNKSLDDFDLLGQEIVKQNTAFMSLAKTGDNDYNCADKKYDLLTDKISAPAEVSLLLNNVYCADDLNDAKEKLKSLACNESIITKDGIWLNSHWFTVNSTNLDSDNSQSILAREQDIKLHIADIEKLEQSLTKLKEDLIIKKTDLSVLKSTKDDLQKEVRSALQSISEVKSNISREESRLEEQRNRLFKIDQDISESISHIEADGAQVKTERSKLEQSMAAMEGLSEDKLKLQLQGDELKSKIKDIRQEFEQYKDKLHGSELGLQKAKQQVKHLTDELSRLEKQKSRLTQEKALLTEKIASFDEPVECLKERLELSLAEKEEQKANLTQKTEDHEQANQQLVSIEKVINLLRKEHEQLRDENESLKIKQHEVSTKLASVNEQILEKELNADDLIKNLPEDVSIGKLRNSIRELKQKIEALGPVNLTAIEEYTTESERKRYLDAQQDDLIKALTSLEEAIAQIDEETKSRFKETFDFVNEQFQYLFPKIFGGGKASLSLSGEDLLDTGVTVMAQPPGKRNSTIHLLSGGEKALTAIALVFSIFRLNPAPFCMLDEVDAPLDDANVARYCRLVKEMSSDIQFIFITHNKVTMTMAEHLVGVTQHELGVSRLVAVDVDEASKLIDA